MRLLLSAAMLLLVMTCSVHAQTKPHSSFCESKSVVMRSTCRNEGRVRSTAASPPARCQDLRRTHQNLGVAEECDSVMITKVKGKTITSSFNGGGGYGRPVREPTL